MKQKLVNGRWNIWTTDVVADWDGGTGDFSAKHGWEFERFRSLQENLCYGDVFFEIGAEDQIPLPGPGQIPIGQIGAVRRHAACRHHARRCAAHCCKVHHVEPSCRTRSTRPLRTLLPSKCSSGCICRTACCSETKRTCRPSEKRQSLELEMIFGFQGQTSRLDLVFDNPRRRSQDENP